MQILKRGKIEPPSDYAFDARCHRCSTEFVFALSEAGVQFMPRFGETKDIPALEFFQRNGDQYASETLRLYVHCPVCETRVSKPYYTRRPLTEAKWPFED